MRDVEFGVTEACLRLVRDPLRDNVAVILSNDRPASSVRILQTGTVNDTASARGPLVCMR